MPLRTDLEDLERIASNMVTRIQDCYNCCKAANDELPLDQYAAVVQIPAVANALVKAVINLQSKNYSFADIAPHIASRFGYSDIASAETDYEALKLRLPDLAGWVIAHGPQFRHSISTEGSRVYDQPILAADKAILQGKLDTVLALFQ